MTIQSLGLRTPAQRTGIKAFFLRVLRLESTWRERNHLKALDDAALKDLGLTRAQVDAEARRPVWDVPNHWKR